MALHPLALLPAAVFIALPLPQLEHLSLGCCHPGSVFVGTDDQINVMRECWQKCQLNDPGSLMSWLRGSGWLVTHAHSLVVPQEEVGIETGHVISPVASGQ